jgi:hypothetical protein
MLAKIADIDEKGKTLWGRIKQITALSLIAIYPGILQHVGTFAPPVKKEPEPQKGKEPPKLPGPQLPEMNRYFHLLGIDILLNDVCDPIVLELNDRPSMCVTYDIERPLKSRIILDALNTISADGKVPDETAKLGGWQKLLPGDESTPFGKALAVMMQKSAPRAPSGSQNSPKRVLVRKLGSTPASGKRVRVSAALPPLHQ